MSEQPVTTSATAEAPPEAPPEAVPEAVPEVVSEVVTEAAPAPPAPAPPRRVLRAVARWTVAVAVFAGLGGGVAYGVTSMERGDVPGLSTRSDGRWDYPRLTLPALPAGAPRPYTEGNMAQIHYADESDLLLPAPAGAIPDKKLTGGRVGVARLLAEFDVERRTELGDVLRDHGVRQVSARGWTMPDGTASRIHLVRFPSVGHAYSFVHEEIIEQLYGGPVTAGEDTEQDPGWPDGGAEAVLNTTAYVFREPEPYGATQLRQAYVLAGDMVAVITHEKKGGTPAVPFHQTVILQNQLLG
ncbi:hypothetical protein [Streptomyces sp. NPDC093109]|uniref:hypothetical protein n=1 Tax=Streptomyces sp. NPDC093109 TaxID=3154977 RepID=UPI003450F73E